MNLLTVKTMTDGQIIRAFLNYSTRNDALCAFYNELAYAASSPDIQKIVVALIDDEAHTVKTEIYDKPDDHNIESEVAENVGND